MDDLDAVYLKLTRSGIKKQDARFFIPPYEWYNRRIVEWAAQYGLQLFNFTPGTLTPADYTYPEMGKRFRDNKTIFQSILSFEEKDPSGLNGCLLLIHLGTDPRRKEKFYKELPRLIDSLRQKGYHFKRIDELIN